MVTARVRLRRVLGQYKFVTEGVLLVIGMALVLAAYPTGSSGGSLNAWGLLIFSLGTSLMATSFAALWLTIAGVDLFTLLHQTLDLSQKAQDMGLKDVHLRFESGTIIDWLKHASRVDFMANTGRKFLNLCEDELVSAIALYGAEVRILISDEGNRFWEDEHVSQAASPGSKIASELEETTRRLQNMEGRLRAKKKNRKTRRGTLEVRKYKSMPYCSILIADGAEGKVARHTPYLHYMDSANVPSFDVSGDKNGALFAMYEGVFDTVWDESAENQIFKVDLGSDEIS